MGEHRHELVGAALGRFPAMDRLVVDPAARRGRGKTERRQRQHQRDAPPYPRDHPRLNRAHNHVLVPISGCPSAAQTPPERRPDATTPPPDPQAFAEPCRKLTTSDVPPSVQVGQRRHGAPSLRPSTGTHGPWRARALALQRPDARPTCPGSRGCGRCFSGRSASSWGSRSSPMRGLPQAQTRRRRRPRSRRGPTGSVLSARRAPVGSWTLLGWMAYGVPVDVLLLGIPFVTGKPNAATPSRLAGDVLIAVVAGRPDPGRLAYAARVRSPQCSWARGRALRRARTFALLYHRLLPRRFRLPGAHPYRPRRVLVHPARSGDRTLECEGGHRHGCGGEDGRRRMEDREGAGARERRSRAPGEPSPHRSRDEARRGDRRDDPCQRGFRAGRHRRVARHDGGAEPGPRSDETSTAPEAAAESGRGRKRRARERLGPRP